MIDPRSPAFIALMAVLGFAAYDVRAQTFTSDGVSMDQVNTAIAAAISAATPSPCTAPQADTLTGSVGVGTPCMARPDATRPTQVQPTTALTAGDGTFSGTWPVAFAASPSYVHAEVYNLSAPVDCTITATATGYSGKCFQLVATTLPTVSTALLGLVVSPIQSAAANLTVRVIARV